MFSASKGSWRGGRIACAFAAGAAVAFGIASFASAQAEPPPAAKRPYASPERIAWRVFDPQEGGRNVGRHFVRMPGGAMFPRGAPAEAGNIEREFFRFAIQIKVAQREVWLKEVRNRKVEKRRGVVHVERKPLSAFFDDNTLSAGDVVVAIEGFRVFKGSAGFPYKAGDFVTLERWRKSGAAARRTLRDMERESRRQGP